MYKDAEKAVCEVCFRHCTIPEGGIGFCGARTAHAGRTEPLVCGGVSSLALDPIEKKPLARFFPGSMILSVGGFGCNLRCPFCQNYEISWSEEAAKYRKHADILLPETLADIAEQFKARGNIGAAFTYNEPLITYEYVRDTARLLHEKGMKAVLVTNGTAELFVLEELSPYIDAMNIDLKGFTDRYYEKVLGGSRSQVMAFIREAVKHCHVELTTLIVPGENNTEEEMRELASWVSGLTDASGETIGTGVPLHISRFFPRFHMTDRRATDVHLIYHLAETAREYLHFVYTGNC